MDLVLGVVSFTGIVLLLVVVILLARSQLVASGNVSITINGDEENKLEVQTGSKLLQTLADNKIFLSSACGGGGTCSQCKCQILEGGGSILPTEESHFNAKEKNEGWRLSCQVAVKNDLKITVPDDVFGVKEWECEVVSNDNVATFIKELILKLPEGENVDFRAGGYVQLEAPEYKIDYNISLSFFLSGVILETRIVFLVDDSCFPPVCGESFTEVSGVVSGFLSGVVSGVVSDVVSGFLSGVVSGVVSGFLSGTCDCFSEDDVCLRVSRLDGTKMSSIRFFFSVIPIRFFSEVFDWDACLRFFCSRTNSRSF